MQTNEQAIATPEVEEVNDNTQKETLSSNEESTTPVDVEEAPQKSKEEIIAENQKAVKKTLEDFLSNPEVRENGRANAEFLEKRFHGNWFTIDQVVKKTSVKDFNKAFDLLNVLVLLGYCYREEKHKGIIKYKITLGFKERISILEGRKKELQGQIEAIDVQLADLRQQAEKAK